MSAGERQARIEANFRAQYAKLDDETLVEIASGEVPWVRDGVYLHAARRAARAVLLDRGVADVPRVPLWDPRGGRLPGWARSALVVCTLLLAVGLIAGWAAVFPLDEPSDEALCAETARLLKGMDVAYHYDLALSECRVGADRDGVAPIHLRTCVTITASRAQKLQQSEDAFTAAWLQRFGARPGAGRWCSAGPVPLAEAVTRPGHPWFVRLTAPPAPAP